MPRGQPDFGAYAAKEVTAAISDLGELAARQGSIVIYDKRGDVVDFDNFEETVLRWQPIPSPATSYIRLVSDNVKSGSQAVKLHTPNALDAYAIIRRQISVLVSKRLGVEISFSKIDDNCWFRLALGYTNTTKAVYAEARYSPSNYKLYVRTGVFEWTEVATVLADLVADFTFYTMKLVVDFNTGKYVRLMYANKEYDISTLSAYTSVPEPYSILTPVIGILNKEDVGGDCWIDDFIFTQAEP